MNILDVLTANELLDGSDFGLKDRSERNKALGKGSNSHI